MTVEKNNQFLRFVLPPSFRWAYNLDWGRAGEGMAGLHPAYSDGYICPGFWSLLCFLKSYCFQLKFSTPGLNPKVSLFWKV